MMEIMHDRFKRRTVLIALDASKAKDAQEFAEHLSDDFNIVVASSADEALRIMDERFADLSAVIIDVDMAKEDDYHFLRCAAEKKHNDTIPIIVGSLREVDEDDLRCLDYGAVDFMLPPYRRGVVVNRIENAIRVKRADTFYEIESMLRELPSNIFLKDAQGRYVFSTHYWHHLDTGGDPDWTIRGKTDLDIRKDKENARKAYEADLEIIRSGKGMTYVIEINTDGIQEFFELIKRPVFDDDGAVSGIIALVNDVTEHELLKRELERRARTDELTGLGNRRSFDEFVREIPRSADFPIAVISADCDNLKKINDTYGHLVGDEYIRMAAVAFLSSLPEDARAYRTGGDEFIALLPGSTQEQAMELVETMRKQAKLFKVQEGSLSISFGTAVIEGPDDKPFDALAHADRAMYRDKALRKRALAL